MASQFLFIIAATGKLVKRRPAFTVVVDVALYMTHIRQLFASNLKAYRHALGWSQAKLAEKVNTSAHYIGMIETRVKFPSPEMMERLAAALNIDAPDLFRTEIDPAATIKSLRMEVLTDIGGLVERFVAEKVKEFEAKK
jgi:transcriptional regulator with XRE-family HTH domain